jgi:hypothetical protein
MISTLHAAFGFTRCPLGLSLRGVLLGTGPHLLDSLVHSGTVGQTAGPGHLGRDTPT